MVSPKFDPAIVQKKMQDLAARDAEFVKLAEARERDRQIAKFGAVREYEFPPNRSQIHVTDWVHRSWLRPFRFVYRNIPRPLRKLIKRFSV